MSNYLDKDLREQKQNVSHIVIIHSTPSGRKPERTRKVERFTFPETIR
jgi:hypothetical protein